MRRGAIAIAAAIASTMACTDAKTVVDPDATALEIVVEVAPGLGADRLQISAVTGEFATGTVPEAPRPLAGEESVVVLLPESLDGAELIVRVDGLAGATVVASGGARAVVRAKSLERVVVLLGDAAFCGDGIVAPLIEPCDDGGIAATDGCSATCTVEPGFRCTTPDAGPSTCVPDTFDVIAAVSVGHRLLEVTFSAPPDPVQALALASYNVPGLGLGGTPFLDGATVRLETSAQDPIDYNVVVSGITRAADTTPLTGTIATFAGRSAFNLMTARSASATEIVLTFSDPPDPVTAKILGNYAVSDLALVGTPVVTGPDVTITTATQTAQVYSITVNGVRRASDTERLEQKLASFTGVNGFDVTGAASTSNRKLVVTFNAPPDPAQAENLANYAIAGLGLTGTPTVNGTTVALDTDAQSPIAYTVTVSNITRAGDAQALTISDASFTGVPLAAPTVTAVTVLSTSPNNGATFYNTGTATVRLTGTQFATVSCPGDVKLDDTDGGGGPVATAATSCSVDSDTQITATFPRGIRTNANAGWHVIVTNMVGSNATSDALVVRAGLVISEARFEGNGHEFVELYNPTATALDVDALGLQLHLRNALGVDTRKNLTTTRTAIPSHGFYMIASSQSTAADPWFAVRDATYNASANGLGPNGGIYISLANNAQAAVLDKVGWGAQAALGFEGTPLPDLAPGASVERKPAAGAGHAVDTDSNASDFKAATTTPTPRGSVSPPEP